MPQDNGGPAFPTRQFTVTELQQGVDESERGMTLLDYWAGLFAAAYLNARWAQENHSFTIANASAVADDAYLMADAMLAEKRRREETE